MVQSLIVYAIVAVAAGWVAWSLRPRGWLRRPAAGKPDPACGPDCPCGH